MPRMLTTILTISLIGCAAGPRLMQADPAQDRPEQEGPARPPVPPQKKAEEQESDPRLEAIGGLGAAAMYFAFLSIGMSADGLAKKVYDGEQVRQLVKEVTGLLQVNAGQLKKVSKTGLVEEDRVFVDSMLEVMGMIRKYGDLLVGYSENPDEEHARAFEDHRKKTWAALKKLLGIK